MTGRRPLSLLAWPGDYGVTRLAADEPIPELSGAAWWTLTCSAGERSLICPAELGGAAASGPWTLYQLQGVFGHGETGVLASLARPLAEAGVPLFAVSSFDTDWLLVPTGSRGAAEVAWRAAGHGVARPAAAAPAPRLRVRPAAELDREWILEVVTTRWASPVVVSRGRAHDTSALPALVAELGDERTGLATYRVEGEEAELVTLDAVRPGRGTGTALLHAVTESARAAGCRRLVVVTSNDNLAAARFYQRRGFRLVALHAGALDAARLVKPQLPLVGRDGIELHDELELALELDRGGRGGERATSASS